MRAGRILPLTQVPIAATLFAVGHYTYRAVPGREYYYGEAATRVCHALNAPVMLPRFLVVSLLNAARLTGNSVVNVVDEGIFLVGVGLLWYVVGNAIDLWRQKHIIVLANLANLGQGTGGPDLDHRWYCPGHRGYRNLESHSLDVRFEGNLGSVTLRAMGARADRIVRVRSVLPWSRQERSRIQVQDLRVLPHTLIVGSLTDEDIQIRIT